MDANPALRIPEAPGKFAAAGFAALVHLLLVLVLFLGVSWQRKAPETFEVSLVQGEPNHPAAGALPPPPPPPAKEEKSEPTHEPVAPPKPLEHHEEKAEDPRPAVKPDIALPELKKKKPEKRPEPKPEPKPEPRPDPEPKKKTKSEPKQEAKAEKRAESKQKKNDAKTDSQTDLKSTADADRKRMNSLLAGESDRARQQAMMGEDRGRIAGARSQAGSDRARDEYVNKIRIKVRGNIVVPPGVSGNPEAIFSVDQLPTGEVMNVRLKHSSGNAVLDTAIERAIRKSSPLPLPDKAELFDRHLELKIRPLEQ